MPIRNRVRPVFILCAALALGSFHPRAQEVVRTGPPPEIRALVDGFMTATNSGNADTFEAMTKERFSPEFLKRRPAEERKKLFEKLRADFGTITLERGMREGPDAPLDLHVKGSTGVSGVISLELTDTDPPRIGEIRVDIKGKEGAPPAGGPRTPPINARMTTEELGRALDQYLLKLAADDVFSGVALVAKNGVPVFQKAYGYADRANRIPNTMRTRFNIGSINKSVTQTAIDQLVAEGKLAHSDTLGRLFPDYPQALSRTATVEQLLNHTAGLADFFGPTFAQTPKDRFRSNADYFRFVSALPPVFAPGARNQYCNGCYIALGAIVERVSGMPYERYVEEHIFRKADMASTGHPQVDGIEPDLAIGYTRRGGDGTLRSNVYLHGAAGSAAGGGYSTAGDLRAYVNARRSGRLPGDPMMGIAGGAPGTNAVVESDAVWTVIVLTNLDPPTGEDIGVAIMEALGG